MNEIDYMRLAYEEAKQALETGEVPIGAVIVHNNEVISRAHNQRETKQSPLAHAEILAIESAAKKLGTWRLDGCDLYVTLEPCPMCAGAIIQSRIKRLIYGALDYKNGAHLSVTNMFNKNFTHKVEVVGGILESENERLLKSFFSTLRTR